MGVRRGNKAFGLRRLTSFEKNSIEIHGNNIESCLKEIRNSGHG